MDNAIFRFPKPENEPVKSYAPGSSEKKALKKCISTISFRKMGNTSYYWWKRSLYR